MALLQIKSVVYSTDHYVLHLQTVCIQCCLVTDRQECRERSPAIKLYVHWLCCLLSTDQFWKTLVTRLIEKAAVWCVEHLCCLQLWLNTPQYLYAASWSCVSPAKWVTCCATVFAETLTFRSNCRVWPHSTSSAVSGHTVHQLLCLAIQYIKCRVWPRRTSSAVSGHTVHQVLCLATQYIKCCVWPHRTSIAVSGHTVHQLLCLAIQYIKCRVWPHRTSSAVSGHTVHQVPCLATQYIKCMTRPNTIATNVTRWTYSKL